MPGTLPDPQESRVVLAGASTFTNEELTQLPAVIKNLDALRELLSRVWGLPDENCKVIADPALPQDLSRAVREAAQDATDTLLIYYAGHGLLDTRGHLYLAVPDSDPNSAYDTAVPYEWLSRALATSPAARRVVILDCCYSGRALGFQSAGDISQAVSGLVDMDGTYLLTATAATALALSPPGEPHTAFTGELVALLTEGLDDGPRFLDLNTIFRQLRRRLARKQRPQPQSQCGNQLGGAPFAPNPSYVPRRRDLLVRFQSEPRGAECKVMLSGNALPETYRPYEATLEDSAENIAFYGARLRSIWRDRLVQLQPAEAHGCYPYTENVDLTASIPPDLALDVLQEVVEAGAQTFRMIFSGEDPRLRQVREVLTNALTGPELNLHFDWDGTVFPWPLLCLPIDTLRCEASDPRRELFSRFLGYRHRITQAFNGRPMQSNSMGDPEGIFDFKSRPRVSVNVDESLLRIPDAIPEVIQKHTEMVMRVESGQLLEDPSSSYCSDDVAYFFCHGRFRQIGGREAASIRLTDDKYIDYHDIRLIEIGRKVSGDESKVGLVFLNSPLYGEMEVSGKGLDLGRAFLESGAQSVLVPQAIVPQRFAAEYARRFFEAYIVDRVSVGDCVVRLARWFADEYHNPLGLVYMTSGDLDTRLPRRLSGSAE